MAKKMVAAPEVVLTEEQKREREENGKRNLLASIVNEMQNPDLANYRAKFAKAVEEFKKDGQLSYDIKWNGYPIMVAEKLEMHLFHFREFLAGKSPMDLRAIEIEVNRQLKDVLHRMLNNSWIVEWDSSTCAMSNQEHKAEARALQIYGERLQRITMFYELKRELV